MQFDYKQLSTNEINSKAREHAIDMMEQVLINPTSSISFSSNGQALLIGDTIDAVEHLISQLPNNLKYEVLVKSDQQNEKYIFSNKFNISGFLGDFKLKIKPKAKYNFDLIIDSCEKVNLAQDVLPFGYYKINSHETISNDVINELSNLIGTFDKPKYFKLDPDMCLHSRNKIAGCSRCYNVCTAYAIDSDGDTIKVDPNLCQGLGGCSTSCPVGAITYRYPASEYTAKKLQVLLNEYQKQTENNAVLFLYDRERGLNLLNNSLFDNTSILPFELEEIGSFGLENYLYAIASGFAQIISLVPKNTPPSIIEEITLQIGIANKIIQDMTSQNPISQITDLTDIPLINLPPLANTTNISLTGDKRKDIFELIDFLFENAIQPPAQSALNKEAPFGQVVLDQSLCTLCMSCISVCPVSALSTDTGEKPAIYFKEGACAQCELCINSCPEKAIKLKPRILYDKKARNQKRLLFEDEPFKCSQCGKPFGTQQIINKMINELKDHPMFGDDKLKHLKECEDCRVRHMFDG